MTEKKEKILRAALELFAEEGFRSTSTSKVAKRAGVSEGLIFRHFENKDGLLAAIKKEGEDQAKVLFADIVLETEPKEVIRKTLEIGQEMNRDQAKANFWKLQYKLKWELEEYEAHKVEPLHQALTHAFTKLEYENPAQQAELLMITLDGLAARFYLQKGFDIQPVLNLLKQFYNL